MKSFSLILLSVVLSVSATPLGDRLFFRRHNGVPLSRRYVLESRTTAPAACAAAPPPALASGTAVAADPTATDIPVAGAGNSTDSSVGLPVVADNSTAVAAPADNSTVAANSTAAPAASRRFWSRGHHGFDSGFDISEESSVSFSFEEEVSSFVETWESLCLQSGGDIFTHDPCNTFGSYGGYDALLETADVCDQQVIADSMITFAKSKGVRNRDDLIKYALSYRRHPRRAVEILGVVPSSLYCLDTPENSELVGVYQEQQEGCDPGLFGSPSVPLTAFGSSGTCPSDMTADVDSCGCISSDGSTTISNGVDMSGSSDSSDSTDSADSTDSTDSTDSADTSATSTDSADASLSTDAASATDSASTATSTSGTDDASGDVVPPPPSATDVNAQPSDISGNVNDPNGRR